MNNLCIVSGYFNPLHPGHIKLFRAAREIGTLFVIINNDEQVKIKNAIPFLDEDARKFIIEHLSCVNYTWMSIDKDESVAETIEDIYNYWGGDDYTWYFINGGDRVQNNINPKEQAICEKYNINIKYIADEKVYSSSKLIENAARTYNNR